MKHAFIFLIAAGLLGLPAFVRAEDAGPSTDEVKKLINQLGAGDYAKREEAATKLKAIGKPALPALKKAITDADDAEIVSRAQALVKRIEIRPLPEGDPALGNVGQLQATRIRMSVNNGNRVLEVTEGGRELKIADGPDGITLDVTGLINGQRGTEQYTARDADQLKDENPDAYALYERWAGEQGPGFLFGQRGGFAGQIQIGGGFIQQIAPPPDELDQLRTHLEKQMNTAKLKEEQRAEIIKGIDALAETRGNGLAAGMEKYTDQCDEFRKTLSQYKLDPGEFLPPPAKTRLGVSVSTSADGHLIVQRIAEKSRAQRIGLHEGDQIRKVEGKDINDVSELRKAVAAKEKGMTMEITREGADLKLEEKEEEKPAK